jgi:hypothetical protein
MPNPFGFGLDLEKIVTGISYQEVVLEAEKRLAP